MTASAPPSSNEPVQERVPVDPNARDAHREPPQPDAGSAQRAAHAAARASERSVGSTAEKRAELAAEQWTANEARAEQLRAALGLAAGASALEAVWSLQPGRWLRRIPDRETFAWPDEHGPYLVKRLRAARGSAGWRALVDACARSVRGVPAPRVSAAHAEARALERWRALGLRAPEPLLWAEERAPRAGVQGARCALVMERIAHARTLREELQCAPARERTRWLALLAARVRTLHAAGCCHRDLYLEHWIVPQHEPGELALLDAGRAFERAQLRARWIVKDLAALAHSCPAAVTRSERWRALLAAAPPAWVRTRSARRAFARRVLHKARRLAAHEPRHWYDREAQRGSASDSRSDTTSATSGARA